MTPVPAGIHFSVGDHPFIGRYPVQQPTPDGHVFISYSHADAALAEIFVEALHKAKVPFVIDRLLLGPGQSLTSRLGEALDTAAAVIALISRHSLTSEWVQRELSVVHRQGIRVVPVKCDDSEWPARLVLQIGDALYVDARQPIDAVCQLPKALVRLPAKVNAAINSYFPLSTRSRAPLGRVFPGTLQSALDEVAFGRVMLVVPTSPEVNLSGKVTQAVLEFLDLSAHEIRPQVSAISSRQISPITTVQYQSVEVHIVATTVFNREEGLFAEDQWRSADATLSAAQQLNCALLLAPPIGTGVYGWPASAALRHWLFGAIRWAARMPVTEEAVWPVLCQPGAGAQRRIAEYLQGFDNEHLNRLEQGYFRFGIEYNNEVRETPPMRHDTFIGSAVVAVFPELKEHRSLVVLPTSEVQERRPQQRAYSPGTPLNRTAFADGDTLRVMIS